MMYAIKIILNGSQGRRELGWMAADGYPSHEGRCRKELGEGYSANPPITFEKKEEAEKWISAHIKEKDNDVENIDGLEFCRAVDFSAVMDALDSAWSAWCPAKSYKICWYFT